MNGLQKLGLSSVGGGFAALAIIPVLMLKDNTSLTISPEVMYFCGVGFTWLGSRLFGVVAARKEK